MPASRFLWLLLLAPIIAACAAATTDGDPREAHRWREPQGETRFLVIAGDGSLPVFDNAAVAVGNRMLSRSNSTEDDYLRLSAADDAIEHGILSSTLDHVQDAVVRLQPRPGHKCFVFATSHGTKDTGLVLAGDTYLTPATLDAALTRGCGDAPTAVVISGCYSGGFAQPPMTRANRVVLTAARGDRTSFGCQAGRTYTVFDKCLLDAFDAGGTWMLAYDFIKACVSAEEQVEKAYPSLPQAFFGSEVVGLELPMGAKK